MQTSKIVSTAVTPARVAFCFLLLASTAVAQGPGRRGGGGGGGPRPNIQNAGSGNSQSRNRGGSAGVQGGQLPTVSGTITQGDLNTGRILVRSQADGTSRIVQVTGNTQIVTGVMVTAAQLQVNDLVQMPGGRQRPGGQQNSSAGSSVSATQNSGSASGNPPPHGPGGRGNAPNASGSGGFQGGPPRQGNGPASGVTNAMSAGRGGDTGNGFAPPVGRVTSTSPLTVALENGESRPLAAEGTTPVMKILSINFSSLTLGDQVMAIGQTALDGSFVAVRLAVNMERRPDANSRSGSGAATNSAGQNVPGARGTNGAGGRGGPGGGPPRPDPGHPND